MMSRETIVSDNGNNQLIPIITTENGKLEFREDNLTRLLDLEILKDTLIAIVSIAGKKRLGKSLFLNLLLRYLKERGYFTKQARIAAKNQPMTDVDSGRSSLTNQSRFQNLVFLIRNWFNSDRSYGIEGGREYLHQELAKFEDNNDHGHVVDGRHPIYGAFQNVSCFLMPEPDEKVRWHRENGPPLNVEDLGKKFISFTTAFAREYLHPDKLPTKLMKAKDLLEFLKQCGTRIEQGCLPKLKDIDELMAQHVIQKAKEIATDTFLSAMAKFIEDVERPNWKSFDDAVKKQKQLVTHNFRSEVRLYVSEDTLEEEVTKMLQMLDEKIGNELIKKMQKKIILYAKQEAVDHFFSTAKTEIQGMENLIWENFDETIDTQTTRMQEKFLNAVLRSDTNVNIENDKVDLENKLTKEAGGRLLNLMRQERKSYVKDASKNSLDEAKEQLEEYSVNTWLPLPYFGTKTIRKQCTKDFKMLVEKDERDSKVVQDIVDGFETLAKDEAQSADFTILGRYAGSTLFGGSMATLCVCFPPAAPVAAVAALATGTGLASFGGAMAAPKIIGYSKKAWAYVSQKVSHMWDKQKID